MCVGGVPCGWMTGDDDDNIVECEVDDASCVICNEVLDEELHQPVALPACGHTFCKPCLVKLQHRSHDLLCPTCRKPHEGEDVANLPLNYLVLSLLPYSSEKEDRSPQSEDFENKDSRAKANCDDGHNKDEKHHSQPQVEEDLKPTKKELKENESQLKNPDTDLGNARNMLSKDYNYVSMRQDRPEEGQNGSTAAVYQQKEHNEVVNSFWFKEKKLLLLLVGLFLVTVVVGVGVALGSAPSVLNQMGFTSKGIAKGSYASGLMSSSSRSNNGTIPRESWKVKIQGGEGFWPSAPVPFSRLLRHVRNAWEVFFLLYPQVAWLQNIGHKGFTPRSQAVLGIIGALTVVMLFGVPIACCLVICWRKKKRSAYSSSSDGIPLTGSRTPEERQFC
ncbi:uncharacterized protein [Panulirus ornatus]|uniref:uncharacterized protein isoform X3 n=1 Tax=Panulirus ornatus TaxID=150431 RepID=UPI003A8A7F0F